MVHNDLNQRIQDMSQQFQAQGMDIGQWLAATGQDTVAFMDSLRERSAEAVKIDLALRAVAEAEELVVEGPDLDAEYARMALQYQQKAKDVRRLYEQNDAVPELAAQIRKAKAFDWLVHHVAFVDETGNAVDRDVLLGHAHDAEGNHLFEDHDHADHDHDHADHDHDHADHDHDHADHDHDHADHDHDHDHADHDHDDTETETVS